MELENQPEKKTRKRTSKAKELAPSALIAQNVIDAIFEKKGKDVVVIDMRQVDTAITDYYVVCNGDVGRQVKAIADGIKSAVWENLAERTWHVEGYDAQEWILLDYIDVVVHVFTEEKRSFYDLERLWGDAPQEQIEDGQKSQLLLNA
jgi:ribosome-associated protein